jgi:cytochrome P450
MASLTSTCTHEHTATIRIATEDDIKRLPSAYSYKDKLLNTTMMIYDANLKKSLERVCDRDPCLPAFSTQFFTSHITRCPVILKELFKYSRNDPSDDGFLQPSEKYLKALLPFIEGIFKEPVQPEDCILTCPKELSEKYRRIALKHLNARENLSGINEDIKNSISDSITHWNTNDNDEIDLTRQCGLLASKVISIFLGYPGPYEEICLAVNVFFEEALNYSSPLSSLYADPQRLERAQNILEKAITSILSEENKTPFVQELLTDDELTPLQKKVMIFVLFSSGQETTASLLNYLILKIAMNPAKQDQIFTDLQDRNHNFSSANTYIHSKEIQTIFHEAIKEFTPAYAFMRGVSKDIVIELRNTSGDIEKEYIIKKEEKFHASPLFAAKEIPNESNSFKMGWYPFGDGFHKCPGRGFATNNIYTAVAFLISRYKITTNTQLSDIEFTSSSTLRLAKNVFIKLTDRL